MGLRFITALSAAEGARIVAGRPYVDLADLARRADLGRGTLQRLAAAGALGFSGLSRRAALWAAHGLDAGRHDSLPHVAADGPAPSLRPLPAAAAIVWDVRASQHSARGHPMQLLRPELQRQGAATAAAVARLPDGARCRHVGMVICRQRPQTASGVCFITLEDETGLVNLVLWRQVFARYAVLARTAECLGVEGRVQAADGVVHVVARALFAGTPGTAQEPVRRAGEAPSSARAGRPRADRGCHWY